MWLSIEYRCLLIWRTTVFYGVHMYVYKFIVSYIVCVCFYYNALGESKCFCMFKLASILKYTWVRIQCHRLCVGSCRPWSHQLHHWGNIFLLGQTLVIIASIMDLILVMRWNRVIGLPDLLQLGRNFDMSTYEHRNWHVYSGVSLGMRPSPWPWKRLSTFPW